MRKKNKRAVSVIVGYAVLIGMTISLSVLVFGWLKFYVDDASGTELKCPDGVSVIITDASCVSGSGGNLSLLIKNKGRHNIDGFIVRVSDDASAEEGFYAFDHNGTALNVGQEESFNYSFIDSEGALEIIHLVEVQSFKKIEEKRIYCSFRDILEISCD